MFGVRSGSVLVVDLSQEDLLEALGEAMDEIGLNRAEQPPRPALNQEDGDRSTRRLIYI